MGREIAARFWDDDHADDGWFFFSPRLLIRPSVRLSVRIPEDPIDITQGKRKETEELRSGEKTPTPPPSFPRRVPPTTETDRPYRNVIVRHRMKLRKTPGCWGEGGGG